MSGKQNSPLVLEELEAERNELFVEILAVKDALRGMLLADQTGHTCVRGDGSAYPCSLCRERRDAQALLRDRIDPLIRRVKKLEER